MEVKVEHTPRLPKGISTTPWVPKEGWSIHPFIRELPKQRKSDDGRRESSKLSRRWPRPTLSAMATLHGWAMVEFRSYLRSSMVCTQWRWSKHIIMWVKYFMSSDLLATRFLLLWFCSRLAMLHLQSIL
jgi:hypothetical protein